MKYKEARNAIFIRDGYECIYCKKSELDVVLHIDHIHPKSKGGVHHIDNLVTSCKKCNFNKGFKVINASDFEETVSIVKNRNILLKHIENDLNEAFTKHFEKDEKSSKRKGKVTRVNKETLEVVTFNTIILASKDANITTLTMSKHLKNGEKIHQNHLYIYAPEKLRK